MKATTSKRLPSFRDYVPPRAAAKSPSGSKENLFGLGSRKKRIAKKKRKAAILTAKARVLEAKEGLRAARRRNPNVDINALGRLAAEDLRRAREKGSVEIPNTRRGKLKLSFSVKWRPRSYKLTALSRDRAGRVWSVSGSHDTMMVHLVKLYVVKNPQTPFSQDTLKHLRTQFAKIDGANLQAHRAEMDRVFASMGRSQLKQIANANIEWISPAAKNYQVARRNPKAKKNLHPLEIGANTAVIVSGLDHLWTMLSRGKKKAKGKAKRVKNGKAAVASASKNAAVNPIHLTAADIAKLPPHVREKLGVQSPTSKVQRPKSEDNQRLWKVTWWSSRLQKRVGPPSYVEADNKSGAIAQMKVQIGYEGLKRRKQPLPTNFMAKEVRRNPKAIENLGLISLVENLQAADWISSKLAKKRKRKNPELSARAKLRNDFLGREGKGGERRLYTLPGSPKRVGELAILKSIQMENGEVQTFPKYSAYIGGIKTGRLDRMIIGLKQPFALPNGLERNKVHVFGEVKRFDYWARKPHLYDEKEYHFTHPPGEEGGRRPVLVFHNGAVGFRGGDYKIQREGVRD